MLSQVQEVFGVNHSEAVNAESRNLEPSDYEHRRQMQNFPNLHT